VVRAEQLEPAVLELVAAIARSSSYTVATGKRAFYDQVDRAEHDAYEVSQVVMADNARADDAQEGMTAFLSKRAPTWKPPRR
jgi:enoyl-CoA hydratase/carnithine racemase